MPRPTAAFAAAVLVVMIVAALAATSSSSMIAPDAAGFGHGGGEVRDDARGAGRSLLALNTNPEFSVFQATTPKEKESEHAVLFVSLTLLVVIVLQFAHDVLLPEGIKTILPE